MLDLKVIYINYLWSWWWCLLADEIESNIWFNIGASVRWILGRCFFGKFCGILNDLWDGIVVWLFNDTIVDTVLAKLSATGLDDDDDDDDWVGGQVGVAITVGSANKRNECVDDNTSSFVTESTKKRREI